MARLAARKRWLMTGPWPKPKTGILQYRKVTPPDLLAQKAKLKALGIEVTGEVQRSLRTRDMHRAIPLYHQEAAKQEAEWERWRALLRDGPQSLSHGQRMGLAADHARAFVQRHQDEPADAPEPSPIPLPDGRDDGALVGLAPAELRALRGGLEEYLKASETERRKLGLRLLERHPAFRAIVGSDLAAALEAMHGADTDQALAANGLHVDAETRRVVNLGMASFMGAARRGLEAIEVGDYGSVEALDRAPTFVPNTNRTAAGGGTSKPDNGSAAKGEAYPSMLFLLRHKATAKGVRRSTLKGDGGYLAKFIMAVGHDDATRVTKADVRKWRDSLIAQATPVLSSKTINNKYLSAVKAALQWGVNEFDLPLNAAGGIRDGRIAASSGRKVWTPDEALTILKATFNGVARGISEPHRRAVFWAPWIAAYTGLRISEVTQLRGIDLKHDYDIAHLLITPEARGTKSGQAWHTGIHKHLVEMGLLDFIGSVGDGPLFYEPLKDGQPLTDAERRSRVSEAANKVTDWVKDELKLTVYRPNHAWRHLFTTRSRQCGMDKEARDYMLGSRGKVVDAREGYGDWTPDVTDREINKQERFAVVDTGHRPYDRADRF